MENTIRKAFASQRNAPNKRLADIIARVEKKYGIDSAELDDEACNEKLVIQIQS